MDILGLVEKYIKSQSFDFQTFAQARCRLEMDGYFLDYDSFSLNIYGHNIPAKYHQIFNASVRERFIVPNETRKEMAEYAALFYLIPFLKNLSQARIIKCVRPDFEIQLEHERIGIEVTELTTETDKLTECIATENRNSVCSASEIHQKAIEKHGRKAMPMKVQKIGDVVGVCRPIYEFSAITEKYITQIKRKYKKYEEKMDFYDDFFILCDATKSQCLTSEIDVARFCNQLMKEKLEKRCKVIVLYQNENCAHACFAVQFANGLSERL